jgi:hypothetical protein
VLRCLNQLDLMKSSINVHFGEWSQDDALELLIKITVVKKHLAASFPQASNEVTISEAALKDICLL